MIRQASFAWIVVAALLSSAIYVIKHEVQALEARLAEINVKIDRNREATHVLAAEWALLNHPNRLERLSRDLLQLQPLTGDQVMRASDLLPEPSHSTAAVVPPSGGQYLGPTSTGESVGEMIDRFKGR
jgi:hypothetical protein